MVKGAGVVVSRNGAGQGRSRGVGADNSPKVVKRVIDTSDGRQAVVNRSLDNTRPDPGDHVPAQDLMTFFDAAMLIGVDQATVRRWVEDGTVVSFHIGPHRFVIRSNIEAVATARRTKPRVLKPNGGDRVLDALVQLGPEADTESLAVAAGLQPCTARGHLWRLARRGIVQRGRLRDTWCVTPAAPAAAG